MLFKHELGKSEYSIAKYFRRTPPIVSRASKEFSELINNPNSEKKLIVSYRNIIKKLEKFKKETNYNFNQ